MRNRSKQIYFKACGAFCAANARGGRRRLQSREGGARTSSMYGGTSRWGFSRTLQHVRARPVGPRSHRTRQPDRLSPAAFAALPLPSTIRHQRCTHAHLSRECARAREVTNCTPKKATLVAVVSIGGLLHGLGTMGGYSVSLPGQPAARPEARRLPPGAREAGRGREEAGETRSTCK